MFTSEKSSRFINDNAICYDEKESCGKRISRRSVSSIRQIDMQCEGGGPERAVTDSADEQCTEEEKAEAEIRERTRSHRRSTSCSTVSLSSSTSKRKRKKKKQHKHHHRLKSNRANDSQPSPETPTPKVNPIFVWIKQDDTKIVQVVCEDYDRRNRIRLTKTSNGWRSIPLTETLEKRWPFAVAAENVQNQLVKPNNDNLAVDIKPDNPVENKQQTDNYKDAICSPSAAAASPEPPECRISSTSTETNVEFSPASSGDSSSPAAETETDTKVPFTDNADPFDSDESTQDDLRSIINKVQTDSLYSDDEPNNESLPSANYSAEFCPVNSTCDDETELNNNEDSNTIQCDEVSGNEVHYSESEPDTNFESQTTKEPDASINQNTLNKEAENEKVLATVTSNVEKSTPNNENSFQSVTSQNENIEFTSHELSLATEILQFNNKQKLYDRTSGLCENDEYFDLRVESSYQNDTNAKQYPSPEQTVSQSKADYVLEKETNLKSEPNRGCENEVESYPNITEISDNEAGDDHVNSSSKYEFPSAQIVSSHIKTESVDTHEVIDDHGDEYDHRKDGKTPDSNERVDDVSKKSTSVVLRTPLCQTLKSTKMTCRKLAKKSRTMDDLKPDILPAHMPTNIPQIPVESTESLPYVQNEPLDLGVSRAKQPDQPVKPPVEHRDQLSRKRIRSDDMGKAEKEILEPKALKKSRLLDLLTSKNVPNNATNDPLEQLKDVLANPKYSVPDPLLVPKARLSALVSCPGKEIPRLLARRAQDLSYFSILSDPDVLVVSLSHLQSLIKKPINEDEIQKYQRQTEDIRARLRQECFTNNYENMASGNWNQCYWLPSFQHSAIPPFEQAPPDVLSVLNCGIPPSSGCCGGQDVIPNNGNLDYHKQMQYQKDAALWQEFALQQLSINHPSYDQFNNNISGNYDLPKDCSGVIWNQDVCPNYGYYPPNSHSKSNVAQTKNFNHKLPAEAPPRKSSQNFGSSTHCNGHPQMDFHFTPPCDADLFVENPFIHGDSEKRLSDSKLRERYDSFKQFLLSSTENVDFLQQFEASLHPFVDEDRKTFKDERPDRPPLVVRANNTNTKESTDEASSKPSRPMVPKIKVRKHLVDPNQRPTLLNSVAHHPMNMNVPGYPVVDHNAASHLWNPFFGSNVEKNYRKLQWTTPATSKAN